MSSTSVLKIGSAKTRSVEHRVGSLALMGVDICSVVTRKEETFKSSTVSKDSSLDSSQRLSLACFSLRCSHEFAWGSLRSRSYIATTFLSMK